MKRFFELCVAMIVASAAPAAAAPRGDRTSDTDDPAHSAADPPNYFPAIKQELARLQTGARCNDISAICTADVSSDSTNRRHEVTIRYSRATDTVYIFIDKFLSFPRGALPSADILLRLMTLNAELVTSKLEWKKDSDSIRLSTVLSVDSNFDRRAFRSQYTALLKVATEILPELMSSISTKEPDDSGNQDSASPR